MKIKQGDKVKVVAGKDRIRNHEGRVVKVIPATGRVIVEGANVAKKHQRQQRQTQQGGIIDKDMPIHHSNVMIVCSKCGPTRIGYERDNAGRKHRVCRKCGGDLD